MILIKTYWTRACNSWSRPVCMVAIPVAISLGIAALFYPGFMSYDTLHALRGARDGVTDSIWPPMVSYIWRGVDVFFHNPSAMHFTQVCLLLTSVFFTTFMFTKRIKYATILLLIYISIPAVLGTLAAIWKDVLMAALFMGGFTLSVYMRRIKSRFGFVLLFTASIVLVFLGICARHNALAGAIPLLFYAAWTVCLRVVKNPSRVMPAAAILFIALTGALFSGKTFIDEYSLPDLKKLENSTQLFIRSVRAMDIAGASLCVNNNLFGELAPNLSLEEIRKGYFPKNITLSMDLLNKIQVDARIDKIWLNVASSHPVCFFYNKFHLTKYLVGANNKRQYLVIAPAIDSNEYGYALRESLVRKKVVSYVSHVSWFPLFKPWFLYLMSIFAFVYMLRVRGVTAEYAALYASSICYFASLVVFGNAADSRLSFYTNTGVIVLLFKAAVTFAAARREPARLP